jgi:hypothetical protein
MKNCFTLGEKGSMLMFACMGMVLVSVFAIAVLSLTLNENWGARNNIIQGEMEYLAEAGIELISHQMARKVSGGEAEPEGKSNYWAELTDPNVTDFMSSGYNLAHECRSLSNYTITADPNGIVTFMRYYLISSTITDPEEQLQVNKQLTVSINKTYLFQHAVFYSEDLEVIPGQDMTLGGKVHGNKDMYLDANRATMTIDTEYVQSAGNIYKKRKTTGEEEDGTVKIRKKGTNKFKSIHKSMEALPLDCDRDDWETESQMRWNGSVKSAVHGVRPLSTPSPNSLAADGYYAANADIVITNAEIVDRSTGVTLVQATDPADENGDLPAGAVLPQGTVVTSTTFYNNREGKWVNMTTIDLEKLAGWVEYIDSEGQPQRKQNTNYMPDNGLLYATNNISSGAEQPGVKLVNGAEIESPVGLTVVTDVPMYVQGDFNTGPSDGKKPAAVMSDALSILSNDWDDSDSDKSLDDRVASPTTVNAGIITGVVSTKGDNYSGGFENLPRLHEKWSNVTLSIVGSFVVLWESQIATAPWYYGGDNYKAPLRDWHYDEDFNDVNNLPSHTPFAVGIRKIVWK